MLWRAFLLIWFTKHLASKQPIILPQFSDVIENSSIMLTCKTPKELTYTLWIIGNGSIYSHLTFLKEGECATDNFLADKRTYDTSCYSNGTFKVNIKNVTISNHGQRWFCAYMFYRSNYVRINVQVPIKYIKIENSSENIIKTVENKTTTLTCETSAGRPAASITWRKKTDEGMNTDLTHTAIYNKQDNGMITSYSIIDLRPLRWDNDTRIVCKATNNISNVTQKEVRLYVQFPPGKPDFEYVAQNEFARDGELQHNKLIVMEGSSFTVICRSDGDPPPTYTWNISNDLKSPNLTFANITKALLGLYECTAENEMQRFPNYERKKSASKGALDIDVLYPSSILQFSASGIEKKKDYFEVAENETIHFICSVHSNPVSTISLLFKEQELWRNVSKGLIYTHRVESCFDAGVYKCLAYNPYNNKPSIEELTLRVRCTPLLSPEFDLKTNTTSAQNVTVIFQFKYIAYPEPIHEWCKFIGSSCKTLKNDQKIKITTYGLNSSLTIRDIAEDDYGRYKLKIYNTMGFLEQFYFLKANEKPGQPTSFEYLLKYVTDTSIILQWKPGFDGGLKQTFTLTYKLQKGNNWTTIILPDSGDKTMHCSLVFLESDSVFNSKLYSENSKGKSMKLNLTFETNAQERTTYCTMTWTLVFVSASIFIISILVNIVATMCFRIIRRKQSLTKSTLQRAEITVLNQTTFNSDDIDTIHEYEQLDGHSLEDREYTEMQTMEAGDDPNRDYITPTI